MRASRQPLAEYHGNFVTLPSILKLLPVPLPKVGTVENKSVWFDEGLEEFDEAERYHSFFQGRKHLFLQPGRASLMVPDVYDDVVFMRFCPAE